LSSSFLSLVIRSILEKENDCATNFFILLKKKNFSILQQIARKAKIKEEIK